MSALTTPRQNVVLLVVLLAAQMALVGGSARGAGPAVTLQRWLMTASSPVVRVAGLVGDGVRSGSDGLARLVAAHRRNDALEDQVRRLSTELQRGRQAMMENERLRRLLDMRETLLPDAVAASVVGANLNGQSQMLVIDRGTSDGVLPEQPVVAWGGAVGRVVMADRHQAKVWLITDRNLGIGGVVQRSRVRGVVYGAGEDRLEMRFVPKFSDVLHGDRVVTSGIDGVFPRGFGVGRVSAITEMPDGTQTIHLQPELKLGSLEEVLVVVETDTARVAAEDGGASQ